METINLTNQEVLSWASCFLHRKQPQIKKEEALNLVKALLLHLNQWQNTQLIINLHDPSRTTPQDLLPYLIRLANFEPLQYIIGEAEFYGRNFIVTPATLIPRPETEELVERVLAFLRDQSNQVILEIGVGTGCMIHTLALEVPQNDYVGVDISTEALEVARENQKNYHLTNVTLLQSDVWQNVPTQRYVAIVSNPPYIAFSEKEYMDESVLRFEPMVALFAKENGLFIYKQIAQRLEEFLLDDGQAFFEIGFQQADQVCQLFQHYCPNRSITVEKDLAGKNRMLIVGRKELDDGY